MYDDSNIISNTFFTELNKNIQSYGIISLQYNYNNEKVINWKNKLRFKITRNIKKEFITLQLDDILTPKKIEVEDSKITSISILSIAESNISVWIIYPDIQNKLLFYSKKYRYRFIANSLSFSSSIKEDTKVFFFTKNGFNNAKDILANGKIFQGIGVVYISEIEHDNLTELQNDIKNSIKNLYISDQKKEKDDKLVCIIYHKN